MAKLNVQQIEALKATDKPYKRSVDTGLLIRVAADGTKTWIVQYVVDGRQRDYRLPRPYGKVTDAGHLALKDARTEAEHIRALARAGIDYQVQQEQVRQAAAQRLAEEQAAAAARRAQEEMDNLTVADLFNAWEQHGVRRKDGNTELRRVFQKDILPTIGAIAIKRVTEADLREVLRSQVARGVNRLAVLTYQHLAQLFRWAEKRQPWRKLLAEGNPAQLLDIRKIVAPGYDVRNARDRVLSDDEIRELFGIFRTARAAYEAADDKRTAPRPLERTTELALSIMLVTLCRVGELSQARWEHVDFERRTWFIPATATKGETGKQNALTVYLSPFALEAFRALHALTGASEWCFPATFKENQPISDKTISKQVGDRQTIFKRDRHGQPRSPLKARSKAANALVLGGGSKGEWTPHDLRRTGATLMQRVQVQADVIDRCQNHVIAGSKTRRHYQHHDFADEMRDAWRRLGAHLEALRQPIATPANGNVVPFPRRETHTA
jgi:integrase